MSTTSNTLKKNFVKKRRKVKGRVSKAVKAEIKKQIDNYDKENIEVKHHTLQQTPQSISSTGVLYALSRTLAQGSSSTQRIGVDVLIKSLLIRFGVTLGDTYNFMRVIIFRWFAPLDPTIAEILDDLVNVPWASALETDFTSQFRVIYDNTFALTTNNNAMVDKVYIKKNMKAKWEGTNNESGNIYMIAISDSGAVSHPSIEFSSRISFTDA